jgi:hypothetical protein
MTTIVILDASYQGATPGQIIGLSDSVAATLVAEGAAASATFTETSTHNFVAGDVLAIGNNTFNIVATIGSTAGNVLKGADFAASAANLVAAVMGTSGGGTTYVAPTNTPNVSASFSTTIVFTALALGAGGNSLVSTYTPFGTSAGGFGATTFTGGSGASLADMGLGAGVPVYPAGGWAGQIASETTEQFLNRIPGGVPNPSAAIEGFTGATTIVDGRAVPNSEPWA